MISYLAARPSRDPLTLEHQKVTRKWWSLTSRWELITSTAVLGELAGGHHDLAVRRLEFISALALVPVPAEARRVAEGEEDAR